jgi:STE24 endopeptidase
VTDATVPAPVMERTPARGWWLVAVVLAVLGVLAVLRPVGPYDPPGATAATRPVDVPVGASTASVATAPVGMLAADRFDDEVLAAVERYRRPRRLVGGTTVLLGLAVPAMAVALLVRGGARVGAGARGHRAGRVGSLALPVRSALAAASVAAGIVVTTALVTLPGTAWVRLVHDDRFGFRTRSTAGWFADQLLAVATRAALIAALAMLVAVLVQRYPRSWPARLTVAVGVLVPLAVLLHPVVVHPLLLPEQPLPAGVHADAVAAVVARAGVDVPVVVGEASLRTTRRNAVATGLGPTTRIVLHDTVFDLPPAEVAALTAHELAHVVHRDAWRVALAGAPLALLVGLLLRRLLGGAVDPRTLTLAVALVLLAEAASGPVVGVVSRRVERAADAGAVALLDDVGPLVGMLRAFVIDDLADPEPPRWSVLLGATHPPLGERLRAVVAPPVSGAVPGAMR